MLKEKDLGKLAATLPIATRLTHERHWVDGSELIAQGHTEENGIPIVAGMRYEQKFPVIMALNHKRNMKKIFRKYGEKGVEVYMQEVLINDQINKNENVTS